ncbi:hypothetical protein [Leptotrichia sp. OH3620_COT-345]|uniref:hypothetical protein n=1 Tax=Leptotrichia sp. OH3620_COT-345 TaxID=2491048 RepID=UPI0013153E0A|nr:hypothetical protein [Leptotrichia sp. OH3620_COT-345]
MNIIAENNHNINNNFEHNFNISLKKKYEEYFQNIVSNADNSFFELDSERRTLKARDL